MSQMDGNSRYDDLAHAVEALDKAGIEFFGPFASSKGEIFVMEGMVLTLPEVLELSSKCQLNRDGILNVLSSQS